MKIVDNDAKVALSVIIRVVMRLTLRRQRVVNMVNKQYVVIGASLVRVRSQVVGDWNHKYLQVQRFFERFSEIQEAEAA